ncbi:MAG: cysteine-rich small domain-containing protein [Clostridium sp.]|nr:cysteine-rich small domain-containing protein [Clostridium sp.]MCM1172554.1 cysteine-rich small domain-containing protein [Clostridium sp.]MCM1209431.1 cysteine-rich small domain-containing protein [Ruminococcus sp.]
MQNSYKYFENRECNYYPCHEGIDHINCLFCFCPLYDMEECPGNPKYITVNGRKIKECTSCTFPHRAENYEAVLERKNLHEKDTSL